MCAAWKRVRSPSAPRTRSSSSIPVGKKCLNETKCERELDAAVGTGAVSCTSYASRNDKWHEANDCSLDYTSVGVLSFSIFVSKKANADL